MYTGRTKVFQGMFVLYFFLAIIVLALAIIGLFKENKIRTKYRGVFGRPKAYFFVNGLFVIPATLIMAVNYKAMEDKLILVGTAVVMALMVVAIVLATKKKCPEFLQKGMLLSMFWAGLGLILKVALFIFPFIWRIAMPPVDDSLPERAHDKHGNVCRIEKGANGEFYIQRADGSSSPIRREGDHSLDGDGQRYDF